jgi:hypothetical protein
MTLIRPTPNGVLRLSQTSQTEVRSDSADRQSRPFGNMATSICSLLQTGDEFSLANLELTYFRWEEWTWLFERLSRHARNVRLQLTANLIRDS